MNERSQASGFIAIASVALTLSEVINKSPAGGRWGWVNVFFEGIFGSFGYVGFLSFFSLVWSVLFVISIFNGKK